MEPSDVRILVVENDPAVRDALARALRREGYAVATAGEGGTALAMIREGTFALILLDIMMPHLDGIEVCRQIRSSGDDTPVLMLTARAAVGDRVEGLDAGADDYLTKPFALDELRARVRALLRRSTGDLPPVIAFEDLVIDPGTRTVWRGDHPVPLTKTEFDLLVLLARNPGIVIHRATIHKEIWGIDFVTSTDSLDVYVGYLRRKTEVGGRSRLIHTVRGVGYVLRSDP